MSKFYITGLYHTREFNDLNLPPIEVEANDRVEALTRIRGVTVWTEEEWAENVDLGLVNENGTLAT